MKRYGILLILVALACGCASSALAIFPQPDVAGVRYDIGQGWYADKQTWYIEIPVSTNDIRFFGGRRVFWLSPKLSSLLQPRELGGEIAARPVYIVKNPAATQGPIFSAAPGQDPVDMLYSGFWQVFYIKWKPSAVRRPITNDTPGDPQGLPDASEADITSTSIVVQFPIVAVGPLSMPWYPAPPGSYRLKQVIVIANVAAIRAIYLPGYRVFCRDPRSRFVDKFELVTIPDAAGQELADQIGANWAPGLANVPDGTIDPAENDTQAFYWIPDSPWLCQQPVLSACPQGIAQFQRNPDLTPVARVIELERNIPHWTVLTNPEYIEYLISTGGLIVVDDQNRLGLLFLPQS